MFNKIKKDKEKIMLVNIILVGGAFLLAILYFALDSYKNIITQIILLCAALAFIIHVIVDFFAFKNVEKYLMQTNITISSIFGNEISPIFEFGGLVMLIYDDENEIIWVSQTSLLRKSDLLGKKIYDIIEKFDDLASSNSMDDCFSSINGKIFKTSVNQSLKIVYLQDATSEYIQDQNVKDSRIFACHIIVDNYQEIQTSSTESDFSLFTSLVKQKIIEYARKYNLFLRQYNNESFLALGEEKSYQKMKDDGFSILDEVRSLEKADSPLSISIGIGRGLTESINKTNELAYAALNIALTRGGDQIVINEFGSQMEYFGSKVEIKQSRSHVRGRVLAASLENLMKDADDILIMGHKVMDFDALGACLGMYAMADNLSKKAFIVYSDDSIDFQTKEAFNEVFSSDQISKITISPAKALTIASENTLVIVVDTHRPSSTMQPELINQCVNICVIDHHRKSDEYIDNPVFQYHEPQSSSASELVTELIHYAPNKIELDSSVSTLLLSGICLDTKFFKTSISSKTFEMAMYLKSMEASSELVTEFFKEEYEVKKLQTSFIDHLYSPFVGVFIAYGDEEDIVERPILAKVADEILDTKGAKASFVIGYTLKNEVSISARSLNDFNVQIIMESLQGGGHFTKAATQLKNMTINQARKLLEEKIEVLMRDGKI